MRGEKYLLLNQISLKTQKTQKPQKRCTRTKARKKRGNNEPSIQQFCFMTRHEIETECNLIEWIPGTFKYYVIALGGGGPASIADADHALRGVGGPEPKL